LFFNAVIDERSEIYRSVLLPHVQVGKSCVIRRAIIDTGCVIPDGTHIGENLAADTERFYVTEQGVVLVTPDMLGDLQAAKKPLPRSEATTQSTS
jgi:glucose-1-phosphate adenylyltransferase